MGAVIDPIKVEGLREFQKALKTMDGESQKMLRVVLNDAAQLVVGAAKMRTPSDTGRARASVKVMSSQREARVQAGGSKAPYYPWLDFGGRVGRKKATTRPVLKSGRYLYPGYSAVRPKVLRAMEDGLADLAKSAGLEMTRDG